MPKNKKQKLLGGGQKSRRPPPQQQGHSRRNKRADESERNENEAPKHEEGSISKSSTSGISTNGESSGGVGNDCTKKYFGPTIPVNGESIATNNNGVQKKYFGPTIPTVTGGGGSQFKKKSTLTNGESSQKYFGPPFPRSGGSTETNCVQTNSLPRVSATVSDSSRRESKGITLIGCVQKPYVPANSSQESTLSIPTAGTNRRKNFSSSLGVVPSGYKVLGAMDVQKFEYKGSENASNFAREESLKNTTPTPDKRSGLSIKSRLISSIVLENPTLQKLDDGFDLEERPPHWCRYLNPWNARRYAHGLSSNFSSPRLDAGEDQLVGDVDFISDWDNIKALLKSHRTDTHLSFLIHRLGNSVTINHLDLLGVILFPGFLQLPGECTNFIEKVIEKNRKKIKLEGKSDDIVLAKEAFHRLLHFSMAQPMKLDIQQKESPTKQGSRSEKFLHRSMLTVENLNFLVGSDIPVFTQDDKEGETSTIRANDAKSNRGLTSVDSYDMWLDNMLMQCPKTVLTNHKDLLVSSTEHICTNKLPEVGQFDPTIELEQGMDLLKLIKKTVESGSSYWLYKAPGCQELTLYNISNIRVEDKGPSIFENWKHLNTPYFGANALLQYADLISKAIVKKLLNETVFMPKINMQGPLKKRGIGIQLNESDLNAKLGDQLKSLKRHLKVGDWIVRGLDELTANYFERTARCIKGIYSTAIDLAPNMRNCLYKHGTRQFYSMCAELKKSFGPETEFNNKIPELWNGSETMRKLKIEYMDGQCDILNSLSDWHSKVTNTHLNQSDEERLEWIDLGCKIRTLNADILCIICKNSIEKGKLLHLESESPLEQHKKFLQAISLFKMAVEGIDAKKRLRTEENSSLALLKDIPSQEDLINWKMSSLYWNTARFCLMYPPFLFQWNENTFGVDQEALLSSFGNDLLGLEEQYQPIGSALALCILHAKKVGSHHPLISEDMLKCRKGLAYEQMGDVFKKTFQMGNLKVNEELLSKYKVGNTSPCDDMMYMMDKRRDSRDAVYGNSPEATSRFVENGSNIKNMDALSSAITYFGMAATFQEKNEYTVKSLKELQALLGT